MYLSGSFFFFLKCALAFTVYNASACVSEATKNHHIKWMYKILQMHSFITVCDIIFLLSFVGSHHSMTKPLCKFYMKLMTMSDFHLLLLLLFYFLLQFNNPFNQPINSSNPVVNCNRCTCQTMKKSKSIHSGAVSQ